MTPNNYRRIRKQKLTPAYKEIAEESMQLAATEIRDMKQDATIEELLDCDIAIDGTWQKRGYSSQHGVVVGVSNKKVIEIKTMSKYCAGCVQMESLVGTPEYTNWLKNHKCSINHVSSSGQMESDAAVEFFGRSVEV